MSTLARAINSTLRLPKFFGLTPVRSPLTRIAAEQMEAVQNEVGSATLKAKSLIAGRTEVCLTTRLEQTSWSVAECLDHLTQTTTAFIPAITAAMARAPQLAMNRSLKTGALTKLLIQNLEHPYRLRFNVLAPLVPRQQNFYLAWSDFENSQAQLKEIMQSASGLAIDEVSIESPVYARFNYNVYGALRMLTAHQRRHLWQIEQIFKALDGTQVYNAS